MHASVPQPLTWRQRLTLAGGFTLLAVMLASLVLAMYAAHQHEPGIVPAPAPVAPISTDQIPVNA